jgi:hypothetical protein
VNLAFRGGNAWKENKCCSCYFSSYSAACQQAKISTHNDAFQFSRPTQPTLPILKRVKKKDTYGVFHVLLRAILLQLHILAPRTHKRFETHRLTHFLLVATHIAGALKREDVKQLVKTGCALCSSVRGSLTYFFAWGVDWVKGNVLSVLCGERLTDQVVALRGACFTVVINADITV